MQRDPSRPMGTNARDQMCSAYESQPGFKHNHAYGGHPDSDTPFLLQRVAVRRDLFTCWTAFLVPPVVISRLTQLPFRQWFKI